MRTPLRRGGLKVSKPSTPVRQRWSERHHTMSCQAWPEPGLSQGLRNGVAQRAANRLPHRQRGTASSMTRSGPASSSPASTDWRRRGDPGRRVLVHAHTVADRLWPHRRGVCPRLPTSFCESIVRRGRGCSWVAAGLRIINHDRLGYGESDRHRGHRVVDCVCRTGRGPNRVPCGPRPVFQRR